jgi:hypothetical protein
MKVICKSHKTCEHREYCEHSIEHEIIAISGPYEQNCILKEIEGDFAPKHLNENCICNLKNIYDLRKEKIIKINEISIVQVSL